MFCNQILIVENRPWLLGHFLQKPLVFSFGKGSKENEATPQYLRKYVRLILFAQISSRSLISSYKWNIDHLILFWIKVFHSCKLTSRPTWAHGASQGSRRSERLYLETTKPHPSDNLWIVYLNLCSSNCWNFEVTEPQLLAGYNEEKGNFPLSQ